MRVLLVDADGKMPNLALTRLGQPEALQMDSLA